MARSVTSGIDGQLPAQGSFPGWLLEITLATATVIRRTSLDVVFAFAGAQWVPVDMEMPSIAWDGGVLRVGTLVLGDPDLALWRLAENLELGDALVRIWQIYRDAANEAAPVYSGRVNDIRKRELAIELSLSNSSDTLTSPRTRVQQIVNQAFLLPSGTVINL